MVKKLFRTISEQDSATGASLRLFGRYLTYRKFVKFLKKSQWWSKEQIENFQLQKLKKLVNHAYENVPYYNKLFDKIGFKPEDFKSLKDLEKIPFLTKEIVRENIDDLKAKNYAAHKFEYATTGGSTGAPLGFFVEKDVWFAKHMAFGEVFHNRANCNFLNKFVGIIGTDKVCEKQFFGRILMISSFHLTDENLPIIVEKIIKFNPKFILGYPSAISIIAGFVNKNDVRNFPKIKAIFCHGESIFDWQRKLIEEVFGCKVLSSHGMAELCIFAGTCEKSNYYHISPEYGFVELVNSKGEIINKEDEMGEIIATGFENDVFPFIRYKTGDFGIFTNEKCKCGRNSQRLKSIEGRIQDFVVTKSKRLMPLTGIHHLIATKSPGIKESQIYQDTEGELIFNVVKGKFFKNDEIQAFEEAFKKNFGSQLNICIIYVDYISRTRRGKYRFLIQKLPIDFDKYHI